MTDIKKAILSDKWLTVDVTIEEARELHDICKKFTEATTDYQLTVANNDELSESEFSLTMTSESDAMHVARFAKSRDYTLSLHGDSVSFGNIYKEQVTPLAAIAYCIISGFFYVHEGYFETMITDALWEYYVGDRACLGLVVKDDIVATHNNLRLHGVCSVCDLLQWQIDRNS